MKAYALPLALALVIALPGRATVLYDVDFDADTPGQPPSLDAGPLPRTGPSAITFGDPLVQGAVGTLTTQALAFNHSEGPGVLEQIRFDLGLGLDHYRIDFDLVVVNLARLIPVPDYLQIHLDYEPEPTGQYLVFGPDGIATTFQPFDLSSGIPRSHSFPDAYDPSGPFHVSIRADVPREFWSIHVEGETLYQGPLLVPHGDLFMVRFSLSDRSGESLVGLDNVLITPEPATGLFVVLGLVLIAWRRSGDRPKVVSP